jgi:hypothetical protein
LREWARRDIGPTVATALQGEGGLRWLSGFLTLFLAFYVGRTSHGVEAATKLGAVGAAAAIGNVVGTAIGTRLRMRRPDLIILLCTSAAALICLLTAVFFSFPFAVVAMLVSALSNALSKLALDSIIQRDVEEASRSSVFARSETYLQLLWVFGAAVALLLPPKNGDLAFWIAALVSVFVAVLMLLRERVTRGSPEPIARRPREGVARGPHEQVSRRPQERAAPEPHRAHEERPERPGSLSP